MTLEPLWTNAETIEVTCTAIFTTIAAIVCTVIFCNSFWKRKKSKWISFYNSLSNFLGNGLSILTWMVIAYTYCWSIDLCAIKWSFEIVLFTWGYPRNMKSMVHLIILRPLNTELGEYNVLYMHGSIWFGSYYVLIVNTFMLVFIHYLPSPNVWH